MTYVRDPLTEQPLLCCWDECERLGVQEQRAEVTEGEGLGKKVITYIFCTERHLAYWTNSIISNGNLPAGMRNPLGLAGR